MSSKGGPIDVFNAVLYELRTGAQWRQLPHDFPKWQTVYTYFAMWSKPLANSEYSLIDLLLKNCRSRAITNGHRTNVVRNS
ncbi:transposase [Lactiplantibacillus plantarum]|uniref:transposase n=1 Tax=Lactiplantibacillus plantarum TaxID=1590 RepID=UPI003879C6AA